MATTDANGVVFYGPGDPVEPIQAAFNGLATSISSKFSAETQIVDVANTAGRTAAVTRRGTQGRPISASDPLVVWRADAAAGSQMESTTNGSAWSTHFSGSDTGWISAVGVGGWGGNPAFRLFNGVVYSRGNWVRTGGDVSVPFNGPSLGTIPSSIPNPSAEIQTPASNGIDPKIGIVLTTGGSIFLRSHHGPAPSFPTNQYASFNITYPVG